MLIRETAKRALGGDEEAMGLIIMVSPKGHMGNMSPEAYAKRLTEDDDAAREVERETEEHYEDEPRADGSKREKVKVVLSHYIPDYDTCTRAVDAVVAAMED
jgi:hypothetical protein